MNAPHGGGLRPWARHRAHGRRGAQLHGVRRAGGRGALGHGERDSACNYSFSKQVQKAR